MKSPPSKIGRLAALTFCAWAAGATLAYCHSGIPAEQCIFPIGPYKLAFTGYQPKLSRELFCQTIFTFGETVIVLDAQQDPLRDLKLDIRVVRGTGLDRGASRLQEIQERLREFGA
jgi:hypothetical protein